MALQLQLTEIVQMFLDIAFSGPLSLLFVLMGGLLVGGASIVFGYLSLRGIMAWLSPGPGQGPPRQAQ